MLKSLKNTLAAYYRQYELVTCIYMFEPWEKKLINGFVIFILALVFFSSCMYLPTYIQTFFQFMSPLSFDRKSASSYTPTVLRANKVAV